MVSRYRVTGTRALGAAVLALFAFFPTMPASAAVGWCNLQFPSSFSHNLSSGPVTQVVYGRVYKAGTTEAAGAPAGITAQLGYGADGTDAAGWTWETMTYNVQVGNDDEFQDTPNPTSAGTYRYLTRFSDDAGSTWTYCGTNGPTTSSGYGANAGTMTITGTLPVELIGFTAAVTGSTALLQWTTASETNNAGFSVQQETSLTWHDIAFVAGRGTTSEQTRYAQPVRDLTPGMHRFRLRQVDFDGTVSYSPTVEVTIGLDAAVLVEARGQAVRFAVRETQHVHVALFNVLGQRMAVLFDAEAQAGHPVTLQVPPGLSEGVYLLHVAGRSFSETVRVLVR